MVSSIHQTGYALYPGSGTYGTVYFVNEGTSTLTNVTFWCDNIVAYPTYYTRVIEEGSNKEYRNDYEIGAPTLPTQVLSEINGSSVYQNLASSALKEPVKLYFKLKDNYSLPYDWLTFEEGSGKISGKPPFNVSSFPPLKFDDIGKEIEMHLFNFGEPPNQPFDPDKAVLFGYAYGIITYRVGQCPT